MEHAPLRPVPSRRAGPIDPVAATREVAAALPSLPAVEARALALVALAERPRAEVASTLAIEEAELGALLASARKELRRTVAVLGGSGWCERAERLISDRLDGPLPDPDAPRLDVHLRNCPRCVEHERRLVQATDWLVSGLATPGPATPAPPAPVEEPRGEAPPLEEPPVEEPPAAARELGAMPTQPAEPAPTDTAAAAELLVAARTRRQIAAATTWNALIVLAVLLALVTIGVTLAGILGAGL